MDFFLCCSQLFPSQHISLLQRLYKERLRTRFAPEGQDRLEIFPETSRLACLDTVRSCYSSGKQDPRAKLKREAADKAPVCQDRDLGRRLT